MRQVIVQIDMTLDGFIADANEDLNWVKADEAMNQDASALLDTADTILLGRRAYQLFAEYWPFADTSGTSTASKIAHQINHADKLVFSRTLETVAWGNWNNARLIKENIAEEIAKIQAQSGKNLVLYAGAEIISTFVQLGLVNEYRLRIHPVVLGSGKPLFQDIKHSIALELVGEKHYDHGVVLLRYQPKMG
ncbi:MAG: dihydrofolate reductase [Anaerolineae bacterium]|nr:dihydrofolate reductase [Anaerolineae bacterium]